MSATGSGPGPMPPPPPPPVPPSPSGQNGNSTIPAITGINLQSQTLLSAPAIAQSTIIASGTIIGGAIPTASTNGSSLPPVAPSLGTPAQQTPAAHPCQSGGGCGCGGTCGGNLSASNSISESDLSATSLNSPDIQQNLTSDQVREAVLNNRLQISDGGTSEIQTKLLPAAKVSQPTTNSANVPTKLASVLDATKDGNLLSLNCKYSSGITESIIAEVESLGVVRVRINDTSQGYNLFDVRYRTMGENWTIHGRPVGQVGNVSLAQFALGAWTSLFVARTNIALSNPTTNSNGNNNVSPTNGSQILSAPIKILSVNLPPPNAGTCIPHDLVCSFPSVPIPELGFTGPKVGFLENDKKTLLFTGMPCIGGVSVNIEDCCYHHDIAYWCSQTKGDKSSADSAVAQCIAGLLLNAILNAYDNFWSLLCVGLVTFFDPVFAIQTLFDFGVVYIETAFLIFSALQTVPWNHDPALFDANGNHASSCLCGGDEPTTPCNDSKSGIDQPPPPGGKLCRDLCKEDSNCNNCGVGCCTENCYNCGWKCNYSDGKLISSTFDVGPNNADQSNCCPGTGQYCTGDTIAPACPTCYQCSWNCDHKLGWVPQTDPSGNNLPCCNATGYVTTHGRDGGTYYDPYPPQPSNSLCQIEGRKRCIPGDLRAGSKC